MLLKVLIFINPIFQLQLFILIFVQWLEKKNHSFSTTWYLQLNTVCCFLSMWSSVSSCLSFVWLLAANFLGLSQVIFQNFSCLNLSRTLGYPSETNTADNESPKANKPTHKVVYNYAQICYRELFPLHHWFVQSSRQIPPTILYAPSTYQKSQLQKPYLETRSFWNVLLIRVYVLHRSKNFLLSPQSKKNQI